IGDDLTSDILIAYISTMVFYILSFYSVVSVFIVNLPRRIIKATAISIFLLVLFSLSKVLWNIYVLNFQVSINGFERSPWNTFALELWRFSTSILYAFAYWIYVQRMKEQKKL